MRQIGNAVPVKLAETVGRSILEAIGEVRPAATNYSLHRPRPEQMRLAIEKRKKYAGTATGKARATKKATAKKKVANKPVVKRPKSVKARYGKHV